MMRSSAAFNAILLRKQAAAQVPDFEFKIWDIKCITKYGYPVSQVQVIHVLGCGYTRATRVNLRAGMQMLPKDLLSCEESMVFIIDSGVSRTSTFHHKDFVPGTLRLYEKLQY